MFVCLSLRLHLSPDRHTQKCGFLKSQAILSYNLSLLTTNIGSPTWAFQRSHSWTHKMILSDSKSHPRPTANLHPPVKFMPAAGLTYGTHKCGTLVCVRFVFFSFFSWLSLVVITNAIDCLERLVSETTYYGPIMCRVGCSLTRSATTNFFYTSSNLYLIRIKFFTFHIVWILHNFNNSRSKLLHIKTLQTTNKHNSMPQSDDYINNPHCIRAVWYAWFKFVFSKIIRQFSVGL